MGFMRFILNLVGFAMLVGGTVCAILGFWGVSRGSPDGWKLGLLGVIAAAAGGALMISPGRVRP